MKWRALWCAFFCIAPVGTELLADTIDGLINEGLLKSQGLLAAESQWRAAQQRIRPARSLDDPMVGVDVMRMNTRIDDYMGLEYMVSQRLPPLGVRDARSEAAKLQADAAGFRYLEKGREMRASVIEAAWKLRLAELRVERYDDMTRLASNMVESVRARYESGQAMAADFARARIELVRMAVEAANMRRERPAMLAELNALLDAPPDTPRDVSALPPPAPLPLSREAYLARAGEYRCALLSFDRETKARVALARAARREQRPMFEVRVEARQFEGSGGIDEVDTGLFMNIPWLWYGKYKGMIAEAAAEEQMARAELAEEIRVTEMEVSDFYARAENNWHTASALRDEVLPLAGEALAQAQAAFTSGAGGLMDVIDAQRVLLEVRLELDTALATYAGAHARLEQIAGPFGDWEKSTGALPRELMP
ncbi:MAG TPA: TolC family protein [Kiritimatiellia bacterium]|nr:TolC family protein [Kiritimatiellia bacterium]